MKRTFVGQATAAMTLVVFVAALGAWIHGLLLTLTIRADGALIVFFIGGATVLTAAFVKLGFDKVSASSSGSGPVATRLAALGAAVWLIAWSARSSIGEVISLIHLPAAKTYDFGAVGTDLVDAVDTWAAHAASRGGFASALGLEWWDLGLGVLGALGLGIGIAAALSRLTRLSGSGTPAEKIGEQAVHAIPLFVLLAAVDGVLRFTAIRGQWVEAAAPQWLWAQDWAHVYQLALRWLPLAHSLTVVFIAVLPLIIIGYAASRAHPEAFGWARLRTRAARLAIAAAVVLFFGLVLVPWQASDMFLLLTDLRKSLQGIAPIWSTLVASIVAGYAVFRHSYHGIVWAQRTRPASLSTAAGNAQWWIVSGVVGLAGFVIDGVGRRPIPSLLVILGFVNTTNFAARALLLTPGMPT